MFLLYSLFQTVQLSCKSSSPAIIIIIIDGYHVTDNWSLDIMYIVLEGVVPVELGCILHSLCVVDKIISLDTLNRELHIFWGKITVDKSHKPLQLNKLTEPGQDLAPTM